MTKRLYLLLFLLCSASLFGQEKSNPSKDILNYRRVTEKKVNFEESLDTKKLDYNLEPISDGHFKLTFISRPSDYIRIKIYDMIGNLILSEDTKYSISSEIEYNFNEKNRKIYVVKVESGDDNLIKKVNF